MKNSLAYIVLSIFLILCFLADVLWGGSISLDFNNPDHQYIFKELRLKKSLTAILCGVGLSTSGLLLQTFFKNPLAGPSVLGINSGAAMGSALILLWGTHFFFNDLGQNTAIIFASFLGALGVMFCISFLVKIIRSHALIIIAGLMIGNLSLAIVGILQYYSHPEELKQFILWTFGSTQGLSHNQIAIMAALLIPAFIYALSLNKNLDLLLLDRRQAHGLGLKQNNFKNKVLFVAALLAAVCTAFCGPIGFVGIAVPYISRMLFKNGLHSSLLIFNALIGASFLLLADLISSGGNTAARLPLNIVMALLGSPVVLLILLRFRKGQFT